MFVVVYFSKLLSMNGTFIFNRLSSESLIEFQAYFPHSIFCSISIKKILFNYEFTQAYQPWVIKTYGDLAKTKTITIKKHQRILKALNGLEQNNPDSSKFRFWVKAKGKFESDGSHFNFKKFTNIVSFYKVHEFKTQ